MGKSEFCFHREYQSLQYHWWGRHVLFRVLYPILQPEGTEEEPRGGVEIEIWHHDFTCFLLYILLIVSPSDSSLLQILQCGSDVIMLS